MLVTATLTPRLRVDNGFRVWNWNGNLLGSVSYTELYSLVWRPDPSLVALDLVTEVLPAVTENFCGEKLSTEQPMPKVAAYKPPGMRAGGSFVSSFKEDGSPTIANASIGKGKTIVKKGNGAELKAPKKVEELQETNPISVPLTPGEKAIKKLRAKIEQITRLKELQASGAMLEVNQLEKIRGEGAIREELASAIANESRTKL